MSSDLVRATFSYLDLWIVVSWVHAVLSMMVSLPQYYTLRLWSETEIARIPFITVVVLKGRSMKPGQRATRVCVCFLPIRGTALSLEQGSARGCTIKDDKWDDKHTRQRNKIKTVDGCMKYCGEKQCLRPAHTNTLTYLQSGPDYVSLSIFQIKNIVKIWKYVPVAWWFYW